jgi:hypothetical protein
VKPNELVFRNLDIRDAEALLPNYCAYLREFNFDAPESEYLPFLRDMLEQSWIVGIGGFHEANMLAFAIGSLDVSALRRSKALKLFDVYIDKRLRGSGVVHQLMRSVYVECERRGIKRIFGNAEPTTRRFFLRNGWHPSHQSLIVYDL